VPQSSKSRTNLDIRVDPKTYGAFEKRTKRFGGQTIIDTPDAVYPTWEDAAKNIVTEARKMTSDISFMPSSKLDEAHASAIESGDMEEAQRMVSDAAWKASIDNKKQMIGPIFHHGAFDKDIHGVPNTEGGMHFGSEEAARQRAYQKITDDEFRSIKTYQDPTDGTWGWESDNDSSTNYNDDGFKTEESARADAENAAIALQDSYQYSGTPAEDLGTLTKAYIYADRIKDVTDQLDDWSDAIKTAKEEGYDALRYENKIEDKGSTSYVILNPEQAKSADPFTYDKDGKLIPLSQRFDLSKQDIRFMPASPELPKTEDGKIDWEGFKVKTLEIAKPLAGLSPIGGISPTDEQK
jgi:hypothetical protein